MTTQVVSRRRLLRLLAIGAALPVLDCGQPLSGANASETRSFESFLGGETEDCSRAIEAAADWSARTAGTVSFSGTYRLTRTAVVTRPVMFVFNGARFEIAGSPRAAISNRAEGTIGILFQNAPDIQLSGSVAVSGADKSGATTMAGIVFDSCPGVHADAHFSFDHLAAGMLAYWCDDGVFGDIESTAMKGRQSFGFRDSAGSTLVVAGCRNSRFGAISARSNYKPVLYCSVAFDREKRAINNEACSFGSISATAFPGSAESSLIALRSARNCVFAGASGRGFACGYYIGRYAGDNGFMVDGNRLGPLEGEFPNTGFSTDSAIIQQAERPSVPIGSNYVQSVKATCAGEFGVAVLSGSLSFDSIDITGSRRPVVVANATLSGNMILVSDQENEAITLGGGGVLRAKTIDIRSGSIGGEGSGIRYNQAFGAGAIKVDADLIRYRHNGVGVPLQYLIYDPIHSPGDWRVGKIEGEPLKADGKFSAGGIVNFRNGRATFVRP
jgi:hypothetical protein